MTGGGIGIESVIRQRGIKMAARNIKTSYQRQRRKSAAAAASRASAMKQHGK